MTYVIFDTEYTTWAGCQEKGWIEPQKKEIVQIGALKVDGSSYTVVDSLAVFIKPHFNPVLSDYFTALTHITNEQVQEEGVDFLTAYRQFKSFAGNDVCFSHAWGRPYEDAADGDIMRLNLSYFGQSDKQEPAYLNIAAYFKDMYEHFKIPIQKQASGEIIEKLHLKSPVENLTKHNALYDGFAILAGLKHFGFHPDVYRDSPLKNIPESGQKKTSLDTHEVSIVQKAAINLHLNTHIKENES